MRIRNRRPPRAAGVAPRAQRAGRTTYTTNRRPAHVRRPPPAALPGLQEGNPARPARSHPRNSRLPRVQPENGRRISHRDGPGEPLQGRQHEEELRVLRGQENAQAIEVKQLEPKEKAPPRTP